MKKLTIIGIIFLSVLSSGLISCGDSDGATEQTNEDSTIVAIHGQLSIDGINLVDKNGEAIALRGMSLFWSQWGGDYYNEETIKWLRDDWKERARANPNIDLDTVRRGPPGKA